MKKHRVALEMRKAYADMVNLPDRLTWAFDEWCDENPAAWAQLLEHQMDLQEMLVRLETTDYEEEAGMLVLVVGGKEEAIEWLEARKGQPFYKELDAMREKLEARIAEHLPGIQ